MNTTLLKTEIPTSATAVSSLAPPVFPLGLQLQGAGATDRHKRLFFGAFANLKKSSKSKRLKTFGN